MDIAQFMSDHRDTIAIDRYNRSIESGASPCESCSNNDSCRCVCNGWVLWFSDKWSVLQETLLAQKGKT